MADNNIIKSINDLLKQTNIDDVTSESNSFSELPEGYYLCKVDKAELTESKSSKAPMVAFTFSVVENGHTYVADEEGNVQQKEVKNSKNRKIFMYYSLQDTSQVRRFVSDMLKFEGDEPGVPLIDKEYFMNADLLSEALAILVDMNIYIQITVSEKEDGTTNTWKNLISWKRAANLELPL